MKKISLVIFYTFFWLIFITCLLATIIGISAALETDISKFKEWNILAGYVAVTLLSGYIVRSHFLILIEKGVPQFLKNIILFLSVFVISIIVVKEGTDSSHYEDGFLPAIAISILIIFLWSKISKRFGL